ncbi:MAG: helix-turn-helix domain-containing protein [Microlunatus sp.]
MSEKTTPASPAVPKTTTPASPASATGSGRRRPRTRLAASQKYEVFTSVLTSSATQREIAEKYKIDRSTIQTICKTAKQGALEALAAAVPGRPKQQVSAEAAELAAARERIARLETTIAEQAMRLHLIEGKDGWD